MLSFTEENYLKVLLKLTIFDADKKSVGTNELAFQLGVKPATASDMLKKLKSKNLIDYQKYGKTTLSDLGIKSAMEVTRKHRLWETFLHQKLEFSWHEVHEVAEQLEHIKSTKLIDGLDKFLNYPEFDPHGDAIPNKKGEIKTLYNKILTNVTAGKSCKMKAVKDNSTLFLQYIVELGLAINVTIQVITKHPYDRSMVVKINNKETYISKMVADNIFVVCKNCSDDKECMANQCEL